MECSTICSAARLSAPPTIGYFEVHPPAGAPPVLERQEERDGGMRTAHRGPVMPDGGSGPRSGKPLTQAIPACASMVGA